MKQSRWASLIETTLSTAAGFGLAVLLQATILPAFGVAIALQQNLAFAGVMTIASIARQFIMRRIFEAFHLRVPLSPAVLAIVAERRRQIEVEGFTAEHDDGYMPGTLARAAAAYCGQAAWVWGGPYSIPPDIWPWSIDWWKPEHPRRELVKAGALVLAELESIERRRKATQWTHGEAALFKELNGGKPVPPIVYNKPAPRVDSPNRLKP